MSVVLVSTLAIAGLLIAILARVPIGVALAVTGLLGYAALDGWPNALKMFGTVPFNLASAYSLSVIPLFILMGAVASRANMARELFDAANAVFSGVSRRARERDDRRLRRFRRDLRLLDRHRRDLLEGRDPGDAAPRLRPGLRRRRGRLGRHARHPDPALGDARDLRDRRRAVAAEALRRGVGPGVRARRALCDRGGGDRAPASGARADDAVDAARASALRAARGMWKLRLLFFLAVVGIYLGWFSPTEAAAVSAFAADRHRLCDRAR